MKTNENNIFISFLLILYLFLIILTFLLFFIYIILLNKFCNFSAPSLTVSLPSTDALPIEIIT